MSFLDELSSLIVPVGTILFIVVVQILVRGWTPPEHPPDLFEPIESTNGQSNSKSNDSRIVTVRNSNKDDDNVTKDTNNNNNNNGSTDYEKIVTKSVNMTTNPMIPVVAPSTKESDAKSKEQENNRNNQNGSSNSNSNNNEKKKDDDDDLFKMNDTDNNTGWRCACEGGFLPPGMLKSFGSAEAMIRLGTGQCYHKQT